MAPIAPWQTILDFWFGFPGGHTAADADAGAGERAEPGVQSGTGVHGGCGAQQYWFAKNAEFDRLVEGRFATLYRAVAGGECEDWLAEPRAAVAYIVVCDQFPRNMFRGSRAAFASDGRALTAARVVVGLPWDEGMAPLERVFAYLPYQHAEDLRAQYIGLELLRSLLGGPGMQVFFASAQRHFDIIARFGRFPHRNAILGRASTPAEAAFLRQPGSRF